MVQLYYKLVLFQTRVHKILNHIHAEIYSLICTIHMVTRPWPLTKSNYALGCHRSSRSFIYKSDLYQSKDLFFTNLHQYCFFASVSQSTDNANHGNLTSQAYLLYISCAPCFFFSTLWLTKPLLMFLTSFQINHCARILIRRTTTDQIK